jgi:N-acetyl-anhydromuramyl-L-alanine amidase AmpD
MTKKVLTIGCLLSCIVVVATACQKHNKEKHSMEVSCYNSSVDESKEKLSTDISFEQYTDSLSNELPKEYYKEISYPTPNIDASRKNTVEGVILHHTAEPTIEKSLGVLTSLTKRVGTHCVIDTDGTRYIMCQPEVVTYHAGFSILNGKEGCNYFTIGIEFQGNTLVSPLTQDQMKSAIEYLRPIIRKYNISYDNIVTHEMIRQEYKKKHPQKKCSGKVDITQTEYKRFMKLLKKVYEEK